MRILIFGCPHGSNKIKRVPLKDVDLILIAGDVGKADLMRKMAFKNIERVRKGLLKIEYSSKQRKRAFMEAYNSTIELVKHLSKIIPVFIIYGNVETSNSETKKTSKEIGLKLPYLTNKLNSMKNVKVINNKLVKFNGLRIGGLEYFVDTRWVMEFKPEEYRKKLKAAKKETDKVKKVLRKFKDLDILISHQPPYKILDKVGKPAPKHWRGKHAGSKIILDYIKKKQPRYAFCAHIHEGKGKKKIGKTNVQNVGYNGDYVVLNIK